MSDNKLGSVGLLALKLGVLALITGVVWWLRPLFHPIIYSIAFSPGVMVFLGGSLFAGLILFILPPMDSESSHGPSSFMTKAELFVYVVVVALILSVLVGVAGALFEERTLAQQTMSESTEMEEFPQANSENPRIVPRAVADVQTRGSTSYRQHQLGTSDIARTEDGRLAWSYAIQPDQFQNRLSGHQRGVLVSDMTAMENREMRAYDDDEFKYGQQMLLHRSAAWNMKKADGGFWSAYYDDPIEFTYDGESYMAFPKTGHEWHLTPVPHTTPTWDGVALVHQDGTIQHLSPEEAQNNEILKGQRLYPIYNAEREAESLGYRNGIVNQMAIFGTYEGVVEPAALPSGAGNEQPFVVDMEGERMNYVYAMEPTGAKSRGLDEVWFFDATTGEPRYYGTDNETLLGPERAMGLVRSEDSRTDWHVNEEDGGQFEVVEPIPTVIDNELWWHSKVVPVDQTDVTRNSFVNAHTGEVVELHDTQGVIEFMSGENVSDIDSAEEVTTENASENEDVAYYIVIRDGEGNELDRIPVSAGEQVEIESEE